MKKYETIFILDEAKFTGGADAFVGQLTPYIEELGGKIVEHRDMGQRQFAHPIKKKSSGRYLDIIVELAKDKIVELKDKFRLDPTVLRVEVFSYEPPPPPAATAAEVVASETADSVKG